MSLLDLSTVPDDKMREKLAALQDFLGRHGDPRPASTEIVRRENGG